eukprot:Hpha_TRINITY_DN14982_c2_g2::TRINITY_DN14982_c2_g2_i1::g.143340::m.143340
MSFVASVDIIVNFLNFRNIDVLQQGLYYINVSARPEHPSSTSCEVVALYQNNADGRQAVHSLSPDPRYPAAAIHMTRRGVATRAFYIRFLDQVEVLTEAVHFRVRFNATDAVVPWGDSVVLSFELCHCSKEEIEKIPAIYERGTQAGWEPYPPSECTKIAGQVTAGPGRVRVTTQGGETVDVEVSHNGALLELGQQGTRTIRVNPAPIPGGCFVKVATREVVVKNTMLAHSEWVPVFWSEWYAAEAPVLVTTGLSGMHCAPVTPPPTPATSPREVEQDYSELAEDRVEREEKASFVRFIERCRYEGEAPSLCARRLFGVLVSYPVLAYFLLRRLHEALDGGERSPSPPPVVTLQARFPSCDPTVVDDVLSKLGDAERAAEKLRTLGFQEAAPRARQVTQGGLLDQLRGRHVDEQARQPFRSLGELAGRAFSGLHVDPMSGLTPAAGKQTDPVPAHIRVGRLREMKTPRCAVDLPAVTEIPLQSDTTRSSLPPGFPWLCPGGGALAQVDGEAEFLSEVSAARHIAEVLTTQLGTTLPPASLVGGDTESQAVATAGPTFSAMLQAVSAELFQAWMDLLKGPRSLLQSASQISKTAGKCYWRTETLRAHRALSPGWHDRPVKVASPASPTVPPSAMPKQRLTLPSIPPPDIPLTFTYPQHTMVEFQVLSSEKKAAGHPPRAPGVKSPVHTGADPIDETTRRGDVERLRKRTASGHPAAMGLREDVRQRLVSEAAHSMSVHLVVFVHGYQGSRYDWRVLRNQLSLVLPSGGTVFLPVETLEQKSDLPLEKLGELLAQEVWEYIQKERVRLRRLSFIGHSMGTIAIRAALQQPLLQPFLPLLHSYFSLSGPHLGVADTESFRVSAGLWVLSAIKQSANIQQLRLEKVENYTGLPGLSVHDNLGLFSHVFLLAAEDDKYVSLASATIDPHMPALMSRQPRKAAVVADMIRSVSGRLTACETVLRFNVRFHPIGRTELSTAMERAVLKAVHVAFLSNPDFAHQFSCLFRPYLL